MDVTRVYKFCKTEHAVRNLEARRIKISEIRHLNDPFELLAADLRDESFRTNLETFKAQFGKERGLVCFSKYWDNPLLWGHYADKHSGMALGFDVPTQVLFEVKYERDRVYVLDTTKDREKDLKELLDRLISTKYVDWQYEAEYRMIEALDETKKEGDNYFVDFSNDLQLREVIIGLKCELSTSRVKQLLGKDLAEVQVIKAGMHQKEFKIIESKVPSSHECK